MKAGRILAAGAARAGSASIREAVRVLAAGGIVAHPTETLYGLAVDPWNEKALDRLAALKGRDPAEGFLLLASSTEQASRLIRQPPPPLFVTLASAFWPGPLTLVVPPSEAAPGSAAGARRGIAIRVSPDPVAGVLVEALGRAITSTSANRSGAPPARTAREVLEALGAGVDLVLDGGPREASLPSSLLDLTRDPPALLRAGAIGLASLREVAGEIGEPGSA